MYIQRDLKYALHHMHACLHMLGFFFFQNICYSLLKYHSTSRVEVLPNYNMFVFFVFFHTKHPMLLLMLCCWPLVIYTDKIHFISVWWYLTSKMEMTQTFTYLAWHLLNSRWHAGLLHWPVLGQWLVLIVLRQIKPDFTLDSCWWPDTVTKLGCTLF